MGSLKAAWEAKRNRETCGRGHPIPTYSGFGTVRVCKVCNRIARRAKRNDGNVSAERVHRAVQALKAGTPVSHLGGISNGKYLGGFIMRPERLYAYCRANPIIGKPIVRLIAQNNTKAMIEVRRKAAEVNRLRHKHSRELRFGARALIIDASADVLDVIRKFCTRLPLELREDVCQDAIVAAIERSVGAHQAKSLVLEMYSKHSEFVSRFVPVIGGVMRSLDEKRFEDGPKTIGDTMTRGLWDEE